MSPTSPTTLALIDDHELVTAGLRSLLDQQHTFKVTWTGSSVEEFLEREPEAELVLLDLVLADRTVGPKDVHQLRELGRTVVIVTAFPTHERVRELMLAGAHTVVAKSQSPEDLLAVLISITIEDYEISPLVAAAFANSDAEPTTIELSAQERKVLALYGSGLKIVSVARHMNVSENTVKEYLRRVRRKLADNDRHAPTQLDLNREARRLGVLPE